MADRNARRGAASRKTVRPTGRVGGGRTDAAPGVAVAVAGRGADAVRDGATRPRILSSSHLADGPAGELSEFEFGLMVAHNAFGRWVVRCMAAAGMPELAVTDVLVLHHVHHRGRPKKLADICFVLNYEDTHVVAYSLKKLVAAGLAQASKQGKEVFYSPTPEGEAVVSRYRAVREQCLIGSLDTERNADIGELAQLLRTMSGLYDQAARAATSL